MAHMTEEMSEPDRETLRLTSHRLLDLLSVIDLESGEPPPAGAMATVAVELAQIGSVSALIDRDDPAMPVRVDVTPMMTAVLGLLDQLLTALAENTEQDRLAVIGSLRSDVDEALS